jgi:histidinol-phosphate aminotransferase
VQFIPALQAIEPYKPGVPLEQAMRRYGLTEAVKLASNEFPLPPFPQVRAAIEAALGDLNRYPDGHAVDLRAALAARYGRVPGQVMVGNGSCELLLLLADALLQPGDEVVFAEPSFLLYRLLSLCRGAQPVAVPLRDYTHDLEAMEAAVTPRTRLLIVCNPNNPTGTYLPQARLAELVRAVPADVLVVIDEAYNEFVMADDWQGSVALQAEHPNVVVLRTFSKIYGLCGLRIGYGLCAEEVREALDKVRQPFNVNTLAQIAALEALKHDDQVHERRLLNAEMRTYLAQQLAAAGRAAVPSEANFMLVSAEGLVCAPNDAFEALMARGVIVRDGYAIGCPGWLRVSIGSHHEIDFFLERLASLERAGSAAARRPT